MTMQGDLLDFEEKDLRIYLSALVAIALSDGLHQDEKQYIDLQSALAGIDPSSIWDDSTFDEQALKALPQALKSILIRDAVTLAHIDY
jgi:hypothetical protein